ncbi:MAG: glycosyltransferase family 9 protein [Cyanobacteria bacterium P01_F01_bin.33]
MRILALVPGGIGDQVLFFPTLATLHRAFPAAELHVITEPRSVGAYQVCPSVSDVIPFGFKEQLSLSDLTDLLGRVREREYDAVVSLGRSPLLKFFLWLTGIPKRVGYASGGDFLLTDAVPLKAEQYAANLYHDLTHGFNLSMPVKLPQVQLQKSDLAWAEAERERLFGSKTSDYVLLHPGASQLSVNKGIRKIYPVAKWVQVVGGFSDKRPELPVVVVVGPEDDVLMQEFGQILPDVAFSRPPGIGALTAMLAGATLMLCTDSAPMHLAVATQTPLVALFGPTEPEKLLPTDGPFRFVKSANGAIEAIAPETVLSTIFPA